MSDGHNPLPGAHLGVNYHPNGLILSNNTWHTSEHGLGRASKNNNHLSDDNQIPEVGHTLICLGETGIFTQRDGHPLYSVRVFHGTLSGQSVTRNNHDHGNMFKQRIPVVYPHPGQWPQKGNQYPHEKQARFLHNTINRSCLTHTRTRQHRTTKAEPKYMRTISYNFLPIATTLKWSPRKLIPRHWSYPLISNISIWFHSFYPWSQFSKIPDYPEVQGRFPLDKFS